MNLFLREWKANRKALVIWCACMVLGVLSGMAKYTAYSSGGASNQALNDLPQSMKALLGMGSFDVTKMSGFYALLFLYIAVAAAIHAALLGSGILAKEERDKTAEFLFTKPVSRGSVVTAKLLAALVNVVILNLVTFLSSLVMVAAYNKGKDISGEVAVFLLSLLIIQLIFLSLGAFLSALLKNPKKSGAIAAGLVMGAYVVTEITNLNDQLNILKVLSPFQYFSAGDIIGGKGLNPAIVAASLILAAIFTVLSYFSYHRRDLKV